jgi:hypothetical protein
VSLIQNSPTPASIAAEILGFDEHCLVCERSELLGGAANAGVFLYKFEDPNKRTFCIVEKFSKSVGEEIFYRDFANRLSRDGRAVSPKCFGIQNCGGGVHRLLLEFIGGSPITTFSERQAEALGETVAAVARLAFNGEWGRDRFIIRDIASRELFEVVASLGVDANDSLRSFFSSLRTINRDIERRRMCWAHNDLKEEHIFRPSESEGTDLRLMDWGMFHPNFLGAEFHLLLARTRNEAGRIFAVQRAIESFVSALRLKGEVITFQEVRRASLYMAIRQHISWLCYSKDPYYLDNLFFLSDHFMATSS